MTKLALCFSGDPRTYKLCFESIKQNLLDNFDCDVFISTYYTNDETKDDLIKMYQPKKIIFNDKDTILKDVSDYSEYLGCVKSIHIPFFDLKKNLSIIENTYNVDDFFFNYNQYETEFIYKKLSVNALGQFYGIYDVSKLLKEYMSNNSMEYDFVLRLRLDGAFKGKFIIPNELSNNEILINDFLCYSDSIKLHDHFFMCKPDTYFKIASLYENLKNIVDIINNNKCWLPNWGSQETLFLIQIIFHKMKIIKSSFWQCVKRCE